MNAHNPGTPTATAHQQARIENLNLMFGGDWICISLPNTWEVYAPKRPDAALRRKIYDKLVACDRAHPIAEGEPIEASSVSLNALVIDHLLRHTLSHDLGGQWGFHNASEGNPSESFFYTAGLTEGQRRAMCATLADHGIAASIKTIHPEGMVLALTEQQVSKLAAKSPDALAQIGALSKAHRGSLAADEVPGTTVLARLIQTIPERPASKSPAASRPL